MAGLRVAVQKDHRVALAGDEIMQPHAVDVGKTIPRRLCRRRTRQNHQRDQKRKNNRAAALETGRSPEKLRHKLNSSTRWNGRGV